MTMKKILYIIGAVGLLLSSCTVNDNECPATSTGGELKITSGIATRASGTTWDDNDQIGVFAEQGAEIFGANVPYSTALGGATGNFTADDEPIYFPRTGQMSITAYYPYTASTTLTAYAVDVADQTEPEKIDLMSASATSAKSTNAVPLRFYHRLSQLTLTLQAGDGVTTDELRGATVSVWDLTTDATYNLSTNAIELGGTVQDIALNVTDDGLKATAIVVPQDASDVLFAINVPGFDENYTSINAIEFKSGKNHNFTVTIGREEFTMSGSTIEDWDDTAATGDDLLEPDDTYTIAEIVAMSPNYPANPWRIRTSNGNEGHTVEEMDYLFEALDNVSYEVDVIFVDAKSITSNGPYVYRSRAAKLRSVSAPEATEIGEYAFCYCATLKTISLPKATEIGEYAFYECATLTTISLPEATTIDRAVFAICNALKELSLPKVTLMEEFVFAGCNTLQTLEIGTGYTTEPAESEIDIDALAFDDDLIGNINLTVGYGEVMGKYWTPEMYAGNHFGEFLSVTKQ